MQDFRNSLITNSVEFHFYKKNMVKYLVFT